MASTPCLFPKDVLVDASGRAALAPTGCQCWLIRAVTVSSRRRTSGNSSSFPKGASGGRQADALVATGYFDELQTGGKRVDGQGELGDDVDHPRLIGYSKRKRAVG